MNETTFADKCHASDPLDRSRVSADLARLSFEAAPELCAPQDGCCAYHRSWSAIRHFLHGGALPAGAGFFIGELRARAGHEGARVLISGGADTGLLEMVWEAFRDGPAKPEITFADRCATPVAQCRELSMRLGIPCRSVAAPILDVGDGPYDVIVAHSFLVYFPHEVQARIIAHWARLLRPGGAVVMSNNTADEDIVHPRPSAEAVAERTGRLAAAAAGAGWTEAEVADLVAAAQRLWLEIKPGTSLGRDRLRSMIRDAGLFLVQEQGQPKSTAIGPVGFVWTERVRWEMVAVRE